MNTKYKGDQFENTAVAMKEINQTQIQQLKWHQRLQKKYATQLKRLKQKRKAKSTQKHD